MLDLHRHDEGSSYDGFGKPSELARRAVELGYTALGISNHGNACTVVKHHRACQSVGIKPILGIEGYFLPEYRPQHRGFHLCLFAKNLQGYKNLNIIQYEGEKRKYYNSIWTLDLLRKHHEGLICTTACVGSFFGQMVKEKKRNMSEKLLLVLKEIFQDDLYVEIQPYKISEPGLQEEVNIIMMHLAYKHNAKCILTSDSHFGSPEDFDTYLKMHEMDGHDLVKIEETYKERYMPAEAEIVERFYKMHGDKIYNPHEMLRNMVELEYKVESDILDQLESKLPQYDPNIPSKDLLFKKVKEGMKKRGITSKQYIDRVKLELDTINHHGFEDYFLMVQDYVNWAKDQGIAVGAGRGSCCNYLVNYALGITEVDSLYFGLEPRRFIMKERHKMPDIDIDFESGRRNEVIDYLLKKYKGNSARVCSYGLYQVDNTINDLAKVCGLPTTDVEEPIKDANKRTIAAIKQYIKEYNIDFVDLEGIKSDRRYNQYNVQYDNIIKHFTKLYNQQKYIGSHAAGVAITGGNILDYTSLRIGKEDEVYTMYDLSDMEDIKVIKFDMLGLSTMSEIGECRKYTKTPDFNNSMLTDKKILQAFNDGNTNGVFQFVQPAAQKLLQQVGVDSVNDVIAVNAMNRPGPLQQGTPQIYAENKQNQSISSSPFNKWLGKTHGTILYQEQIMQMAVDLAGMSWDEAHKITKISYGSSKHLEYFENPDKYPKYLKAFIEGCRKIGVNKETAEETFKSFYSYSFNEGHSTGYTLLSVEQMYYKVYYPNVFWYAKLKYTDKSNMTPKVKEDKLFKYMVECVKDGGIIMLPHVNCSANYSLRKFDGEWVIQQGLSSIKYVGEKAAEFIVNERKQNGLYTSFDEFYDRCKGRVVTTRVIAALKETGAAFEFNQAEYLKRVTAYNATLYQKSFNRRR